MSELQTRLQEITRRIAEAEPGTRHQFQHALERVIADMEAAGIEVPAEAHDLNDVLLTEAVEARCDNMPV